MQYTVLNKGETAPVEEMWITFAVEVCAGNIVKTAKKIFTCRVDKFLIYPGLLLFFNELFDVL